MFFSKAEKELLFFRIEQLHQQVLDLTARVVVLQNFPAEPVVETPVTRERKPWSVEARVAQSKRMTKSWTPERREQHSKRMKKALAKKKENA